MHKATILLVGLSVASAAVLAEGEPPLPKPWTAQIPGADGRKIAATLWPAPDAERKEKPAPAILFVHGLGRSREDWEIHAPIFQRLGIVSCAADLSGHGGTPGGEDASDTVRDERAYEDLGSVVSFFLRRREVDANRFLMIGADWGGNLAVRYAAEHPGRAAGLALLSPRWEIRTVSIREAAGKLGLPVLLAGAEAESGFADVAEIRKALGEGKARRDVVAVPRAVGNVHGARLLEAAGEAKPFAERILAWILERADSRR